MSDAPGPWLAIAAMGLFHGLNPAMGWLFAVALGLQRGSRGVVLAALVPIAFGHALAIAALLGAFLSLSVMLEQAPLRWAGGALLIGWAVYHGFRGHRHRYRFGMTSGVVGLVSWSFLMATAHGAGAMLIPVVMPLGLDASAHGPSVWRSLTPAVLAVMLHTGVMLLATGSVAWLVYERFGVAFLRRGWLNADPIWTAALALAGLALLLT